MSDQEKRCFHTRTANIFDQSGTDPVIESLMCQDCLRRFEEVAELPAAPTSDQEKPQCPNCGDSGKVPVGNSFGFSAIACPDCAVPLSIPPLRDPIEDMAGKAAEEWIPATSHFPLADATRSALAVIIARHYRDLAAAPMSHRLTEEQAEQAEDEMRKTQDNPTTTSEAMRLFMQSPMPCGHSFGNLLTCYAPPFGCVVCNSAAEREKQVRELVLAARTILDDNTTTMQHVTDRQRLRTILEQFKGVK